MWQENLFSNMLVAFILISLVVIVYLKVTKKTIPEFIRELKEVNNE